MTRKVPRTRDSIAFVRSPNFRLAHKPPTGQVRERWQDLWPFFVSSLHQTGAAISARISATPAQTPNVGSGIHLPSAPRNPDAWTARPLGSARKTSRHVQDLLAQVGVTGRGITTTRYSSTQSNATRRIWLRRALRAGDSLVVGGCYTPDT